MVIVLSYHFVEVAGVAARSEMIGLLRPSQPGILLDILSIKELNDYREFFFAILVLLTQYCCYFEVTRFKVVLPDSL